MVKIFLEIINMSITASPVIIFVIIARILLKKAPKIFSYSLWSVVLYRLICPFSFESIMSIIPINTSSLTKDILYSRLPKINTEIGVIDKALNAYLPAGTPHTSINPIHIWAFIGGSIWVIGIAVILLYSLISLVKLKKDLKNAVKEKENIYVSEKIDTPFVFGFINPKIYLPVSLGADEREYILLHEQTHIKRNDHAVKIFSFFVLCLHWFNPFVWLAFFLSGKDMEMSCDEAVIKRLGSGVKSEYSSSLLSLATGKSLLGATPLAFGEGDTKERVKNVLNYKKPSFWIIVIALIVCVSLAFSLMTNPKTSQNPSQNLSQNPSDDTAVIQYADTLDNAVSRAILGEDGSDYSDFATEAHVILGTEVGESADGNSIVTVFAMAMNMEFDYLDGWLDETGGSHMPVAISFDVNEKEEYSLKEYWMPMDGAGYGPSIKEKFPSGLYKNAIDTQKYVYGQIMDCYDDAIRYGELSDANVGKRIEDLLEIIISSPMESSSQQAYIDEHPIEYREIVFIGRHALDYCFAEFEKGNETGLKGNIMASACQDIMAVYGEEFNGSFSNGQEWYDAYKVLVSQNEDN